MAPYGIQPDMEAHLRDGWRKATQAEHQEWVKTGVLPGLKLRLVSGAGLMVKEDRNGSTD